MHMACVRACRTRGNRELSVFVRKVRRNRDLGLAEERQAVWTLLAAAIGTLVDVYSLCFYLHSATYPRYTSPCPPIPSCPLTGDILYVTFSPTASQLCRLRIESGGFQRGLRDTGAYKICDVSMALKLVADKLARLDLCFRIRDSPGASYSGAIKGKDS